MCISTADSLVTLPGCCAGQRRLMCQSELKFWFSVILSVCFHWQPRYRSVVSGIGGGRWLGCLLSQLTSISPRTTLTSFPQSDCPPMVRAGRKIRENQNEQKLYLLKFFLKYFVLLKRIPQRERKKTNSRDTCH